MATEFRSREQVTGQHRGASFPSAPATGCYLYAVVEGTGASAATAETGIQPGGPVGGVYTGSLTAIVSDVDIVGMRRGRDEADVGDRDWLARATRTHDRVVAAAFRSAPTVPVRFGVVYSDRMAVAQMLNEHAGEFRRELDRLAGLAEWNVEVLVGPRRQSGPVVRELVALLDRMSLGRVDVWHRRPGLDGPTSFTATCLVERADERRLVAAVHELGRDADCARIELDGPRPPFHFTELRRDSVAQVDHPTPYVPGS